MARRCYGVEETQHTRGKQVSRRGGFNGGSDRLGGGVEMIYRYRAWVCVSTLVVFNRWQLGKKLIMNGGRQIQAWRP